MKYHFFDLGGTLIDSVGRKKNAAEAYAKERGIKSLELLGKIDIASTRTRDLLNHLLGGNVPEDELLVEYELFRQIEQNIPALIVPGSEEYLSRLTISGHKIALVTNSRIRESIDDIISNIPSSIRGYFSEENIFCRIKEDEPKKPDPFLYLKALKSMGADGNDTYAYEDTRRGLQAAVKAGISNCIGVMSSDLHNETRLLSNGAIYTIRDFSKIKK